MSNVIAKLEKLKRLVPDNVDEIKGAVASTLKLTAALGQTPDGTPWESVHEGFGKPLSRAAEVIQVLGSYDGSTLSIVARLTEKHYVLHHMGIANGAVRRQIIPEGEHEPVHAAIRAVLDGKFKEDA